MTLTRAKLGELRRRAEGAIECQATFNLPDGMYEPDLWRDLIALLDLVEKQREALREIEALPPLNERARRAIAREALALMEKP